MYVRDKIILVNLYKMKKKTIWILKYGVLLPSWFCIKRNRYYGYYFNVHVYTCTVHVMTNIEIFKMLSKIKITLHGMIENDNKYFNNIYLLVIIVCTINYNKNTLTTA